MWEQISSFVLAFFRTQCQAVSQVDRAAREADTPTPPSHRLTSWAAHTEPWCNPSPLAYRCAPLMGGPGLEGGWWQLLKPGCYTIWQRRHEGGRGSVMTQREKKAGPGYFGAQDHSFIVLFEHVGKCVCEGGQFFIMIKIRCGLDVLYTQPELIIKWEKSGGLIVSGRVTGWILAHSHTVMGREAENMIGGYLINVIFLSKFFF